MFQAFIHGTALALGLILPLGVQNVFIFNQGATNKRLIRSLPAVLTASICDTILILLAVTGVSIIVFRFEWLTNLIFIIGFFFLIYMGWSIFKSKNEKVEQQNRVQFSSKRQITFAASVSLLNPHAIIDIIAVIGPNSLAYKGYELVIFTLSCIGVSWIWFLGLALAGGFLGKVDTTGKMVGIFNKASACIIWGMALYIGLKIIAGLK